MFDALPDLVIDELFEDTDEALVGDLASLEPEYVEPAPDMFEIELARSVIKPLARLLWKMETRLEDGAVIVASSPKRQAPSSSWKFFLNNSTNA